MEFTLQFNTNKFSVFRPLFLTFSIKPFSNPSSTIQNPYQLVYMYRFFFVTLSYIILIDGLFVKYCDCSCQQLTKSLHKTTFFIIVFFFFLNLVFKLMIRNIYIQPCDVLSCNFYTCMSFTTLQHQSLPTQANNNYHNYPFQMATNPL